MNKIETFNLLTSTLALIISAATFYTTKKLNSKQLEALNLQIESWKQEMENKDNAQFQIGLSAADGSHKFTINNIGQGSAYDVDFRVLDCKSNPLGADLKDKFPLSEMRPNSEVKLLASIYLGSPSKYKTSVSWKNKTGEVFEEIHWVTL